MSSKLSPNFVDPDVVCVDAVTYNKFSIEAIPVIRKLLADKALLMFNTSKLPEFAENIVIR